MLQAPIPDDEEKRLALLKACKIIYTPAEEAFDDVARLAADICGTEIALITLIDSDYQWFKAKVGVDHVGTARDLSFCGHCITRPMPLVVEDTHGDPRFADNPLVTGDPFIRFYAGVPLEVDEGSSVGALSVADRAPRKLPARQLDALRRLAAQVSRELRVRRDLDRVSASIRPPSDDMPIGPGAVIGRWRVSRELGRGSVGVVFEAHDTEGGRVAIKVLLPAWQSDAQAVERFAREARVLMRLKSPHVGKLIDVGNLPEAQGDLPFLVLEFLEGADLDQVLRKRGRVPYREAFAWAADACDGLAEAHGLGVVHRDLKPSNVFLADGAASARVVKVLDFGIAAGDPTTQDDSQPLSMRFDGTGPMTPSRGRGRLTRVDYMLGSPAYMSPEQMVASTDVDARSDIWSMGALLYELVTGQLPFPGDGLLAMFAAAMTKPPLPLRAHVTEPVPSAAEQVLLRCLRKDRDSRYPSMVALRDALREASKAA